MNLDITKMGERGQIVIPQEIREKLKLKQGEKFLIINDGEDIIFRPSNKIKSLKQLEEDIIDMQIASKRWKEIEEGKFSKSKEKEFLKELKNW